jgi:hypothetical protein
MRVLSPVLAATLALASLPATAAPMETRQFQAALSTARAYAADRTLIFYCFRQEAEQRPFLWVTVHFDLQEALQRFKAAGADHRQNAELGEAVLANVRAFAADAKDATLEAQCRSKDVENAAATFNGVGVPLFVRPPFNQLGR